MILIKNSASGFNSTASWMVSRHLLALLEIWADLGCWAPWLREYVADALHDVSQGRSSPPSSAPACSFGGGGFRGMKIAASCYISPCGWVEKREHLRFGFPFLFFGVFKHLFNHVVTNSEHFVVWRQVIFKFVYGSSLSIPKTMGVPGENVQQLFSSQHGHSPSP